MTARNRRSEPARVVAYVRISRDTDNSTSISRQVDVTNRYAEGRGWEVVDGAGRGRVREQAAAGPARPVAVRALVHAGEADAVLVWRLDRLARSVVDFGTLLDEGLQVVSCTEPLDTTTPMGRAMAEVLQVFAALESNTIGQRVRSARDFLASNHRHPGGSAPYGYRTVPHPSGQGRALEVEPTEAEHVRAAADHVIAGGSLYSAVHLLRERGSKPRRAEVWSLSSLRVVLTQDATLGRLTHRGAVVRDDDGLPVQPWEAVLPVGDVERLRALLARKPAGERRKRATRLLSGLVVCDGCGGSMRVSTSRVTKGKPTVLRYACKANSDGRSCPHPSSINAELLEAFMADGLLSVAGDEPMREKVVTVRDVPELAQVTAALGDLGSAITRPGAKVATIAAQIDTLQQRRDELESTRPSRWWSTSRPG